MDSGSVDAFSACPCGVGHTMLCLRPWRSHSSCRRQCHCNATAAVRSLCFARYSKGDDGAYMNYPGLAKFLEGGRPRAVEKRFTAGVMHSRVEDHWQQLS